MLYVYFIRLYWSFNPVIYLGLSVNFVRIPVSLYDVIRLNYLYFFTRVRKLIASLERKTSH